MISGRGPYAAVSALVTEMFTRLVERTENADEQVG